MSSATWAMPVELFETTRSASCLGAVWPMATTGMSTASKASESIMTGSTMITAWARSCMMRARALAPPPATVSSVMTR